MQHLVHHNCTSYTAEYHDSHNQRPFEDLSKYQLQFHYDQDYSIDIINNIMESQSCRMIFTKSELILI